MTDAAAVTYDERERMRKDLRNLARDLDRISESIEVIRSLARDLPPDKPAPPHLVAKVAGLEKRVDRLGARIESYESAVGTYESAAGTSA